MTIEQLREAVRANFDAVRPHKDGVKLSEHYVAHYSREELIQMLVTADYREIDYHLADDAYHEDCKA